MKSPPRSVEAIPTQRSGGEQIPRATMRTSVASIALIQKREQGQTQWLVQWNRNWRCYNFVGGHKHPDEDFRECLLREVKEELGLDEGSDYAVADGPRAHLEYTAW